MGYWSFQKIPSRQESSSDAVIILAVISGLFFCFVFVLALLALGLWVFAAVAIFILSTVVFTWWRVVAGPRWRRRHRHHPTTSPPPIPENPISD